MKFYTLTLVVLSLLKDWECYNGQVHAAVQPGAGPTFGSKPTQEVQSKIQQDIDAALANPTIDASHICVPLRSTSDVESALIDFSPASDGRLCYAVWKFLVGVATSPTFSKEVWQTRPLLIRSQNTGGWIQGAFTLEKDLRLVDGSYITGYKTAEILRNGTKTDTWALSPLKDNPAKQTKWSDVAEALSGGTIYFNTAGSLWKNLGGLCRLTAYAFGLPPNVNVYVTPAKCSISVPPHTDQQDVFVFQTQGSKRWRVFAPPPRKNGKDPLARGKAEDVLSFDEMGPPLIDTVLRPGDWLYVPTGFPHTTDTCTAVDGMDESVFDETSVHLTMGLDTHVWCLAMAHFRWTLLQRCNKKFNVDIKDDPTYWKAMNSIPFGFLGGQAWRLNVDSINKGNGIGQDFKNLIRTRLIDVLQGMEPSRWKEISEEGTEEMPSDSEINEVTEFFVNSHWKRLMETQEDLFKDVDPTNENCLLKAFRGTQEQNFVMENFGAFSNNKAFEESFRSRRLANEQRAADAMRYTR